MIRSRIRAFLSGAVFWMAIAFGVVALSGLYEWLQTTSFQ